MLHIIHISGKWMKASGVDGLLRGDLTEGMMAGRDPLLFIPFNQGAEDRSGGQVSTWVRSWWKMKRGTDFGGFPLRTITKDNMFELRDLKAARLWIMPPAAMEVVLELLCKDCLAHPQWTHVFVVPCLMIHLWGKDLMKNADLLFTVPEQVPFCTSEKFEPLIVVVILPLSHVPSYTGPWVVKGTVEGEQAERTLQWGFKMGEPDDTGKFHELDGFLRKVWKDLESRSWFVLQQFLDWGSNFLPVQKCLVRGMLSGGKQQQVPRAGQPGGDKKHNQLGD